MFNKMTLRKFLPPRRQERKEKSFYTSPNLACFASLRESSSPSFCNSRSNPNFKYLWLGLTASNEHGVGPVKSHASPKALRWDQTFRRLEKSASFRSLSLGFNPKPETRNLRTSAFRRQPARSQECGSGFSVRACEACRPRLRCRRPEEAFFPCRCCKADRARLILVIPCRIV